MFDIHRWAAWAADQVFALNSQGFQATVTFTDLSKRSDSPAFSVDLDNEYIIGRIIFWLTGDCVAELIRIADGEALPVFDRQPQITDENFEVVFGYFVECAKR